MKDPHTTQVRITPALLVSFAIGLSRFASAGFAAETTSVPPPERTIELSPFVVGAETTSGYSSDEATVGGRVKSSLFEATQPVSVITRALIDDVGTNQILDAMKYVAGVTQGTQSVGADRMNVRGFQVLSTGLIDGFQTGGNWHQDPILFDRFEVVRGPNAIVSPEGAPGGTANLVTKSPQFNRNSYTAQIEVGTYDSNRAGFDANQVLTKNLAIRLTAAGQDDEGFFNNYEHNIAIMGGVSWRFKQSNQLTFKFIYQYTNDQNFVGTAIDPLTDTSTKNPQLFPGLPKNSNPYNPDDIRYNHLHTYELLYTANVAPGLSTRVAAQTSHDDPGRSGQYTIGITGGAQGDYDPLTGKYVAGVLFNKTAPYGVAGPAAVPTSTYSRQSNSPVLGYNQAYRDGVQNDWVYLFKNDRFGSQTSGGLAYNDLNTPHNYSFPFIRGTANPTTGVDTFNIFGPYYSPVSGIIAGRGPRTDNESRTRTRQVYATEVVKLFKDRLILNGGLSQSWFKFYNHNRLNAAASYDISLKGKLQKSYGALIEPIANTALYYGHSEVTTFSSAGVPPAAQTQDAKSDEFGVRQRFLEGKGLLTVDYYQVSQNNYSVPNPLNADPSRLGLPTLPNLASDRIARGWEVEFNAALTKELSVVGNYTKFKNRDAANQVFRGTGESSAAAWMKYDFLNGVFKGLGVGVGADYIARRPGDAPIGGFTAASTPTNVIIYSPTFWIPARTIANFSASYRVNQHFKLQLTINNLLNKSYIDSALSRTGVEWGGTRNFRGQATYTF